MLLHWLIIITYPDIVHSYEQFNDSFPFNPLELDCTVPNAASNLACNKLTDVVTYKTRYIHYEGKHITISFGLGECISVNAIIQLPTIKE